jgi:hypothetical protein
MRSNQNDTVTKFGGSEWTLQWSLLMLILSTCCASFAVGFVTGFAAHPTTRISQTMLCALVSARDATAPAGSVQETSSPLRRCILAGLLTTVTTGTTETAKAADTGAEVRGTPVNAFNSLMFQYRGNTFNGLSEQEIDEPSISYLDFCSKLKTGDVTFVEFLAPYGDVAYATLKSNNGRPIRVGAGYPIEQHDGYSSPAFAIRTVSNAGVPYKFTVPALSSSAKPKPALAKLTK